jgi:hypothetical protein
MTPDQIAEAQRWRGSRSRSLETSTARVLLLFTRASRAAPEKALVFENAEG